MQLKKGQIIDVTIEKVAFGGMGIGKCCVPEKLLQEQPSAAAANGMMTFVPNVVPGDRIRASLTKIKRNHLEARLEEVVEPASLRIPPRCVHFEICGGCTWQNLDYSDQLGFKEQIVRETLAHLGGFSPDDVDRVMRPILGSDPPWNYRNKMELTFGTSEEGKVILGFHLPHMRYEVFDLKECFLQSEWISKIAHEVCAFANEEGLTVYDQREEGGILKNLIIREGKQTGDLMVNLVTSKNPFTKADRFVERMTQGEWADQITSLLWTTVDQQRGRRTLLETQTLAGQPVIYEELRLEDGNALRFEISHDSFFQPNTKQAEVLYQTVIEMAELTGKEVVYDLYCGTGTIGLFCAHRAKSVYGIEMIENAVLNARENAERNGIHNVEFWVGAVDKVLATKIDEGSLPTPDVVIVDPPRAGLEGSVCEKVAMFGASKIVYVSCNPGALTRDLVLFGTLGYRLEAVQPVDMFPQTHHIENVALLRKS